ncbi:MAG: hypothetical protein M0Q15_15980 [Nevskia sp.]|nr:hypothetical protein [Nevskia sp.]
MRPPVTYPVSLADLVNIADAAAELDAMKIFYVDRPDLQKLIAGRVDQLHDIVQRAAAHDAELIYAPSDEPAEEGAP